MPKVFRVPQFLDGDQIALRKSPFSGHPCSPTTRPSVYYRTPLTAIQLAFRPLSSRSLGSLVGNHESVRSEGCNSERTNFGLSSDCGEVTAPTLGGRFNLFRTHVLETQFDTCNRVYEHCPMLRKNIYRI